jgi:hypothetical protein
MILLHLLLAVHNKLKPKAASLPSDIMYFSGEDLGDVWVDYREFALMTEMNKQRLRANEAFSFSCLAL